MHRLAATIVEWLLKKGRSCYVPALLLTLIHPRAWKASFSKSAFTDLY
jgi:hypothetical protein